MRAAGHGAGERDPLLLATGERGGQAVFEIKLWLLAVVFVYAFFQFTWSLGQFNYCCLMIGAAPGPSEDADTKAVFVRHAARLQELAADSFNRGLRAYYFALAMLPWFFSAQLFLLASVAVVAILYRREFRSKTFKALKGAMEEARPRADGVCLDEA